MESYKSPSGVEVSLSDPNTWKQFYPKTEMIVTKRNGRVIFPHLNYNIKGLDRNAHYEIYIHMERADGIKYKFDNGRWQELGKGDPVLPIQYKQHPDGARPGEHWMKAAVSFSHFKITNDPENTDDRLILVQSMHKFRPVITIKKTGDAIGEEFRLSITEFYVVTAYQCTAIRTLKVAHNKFASGFRPNGKRENSGDTSPDNKRRSTSSESTSSPLAPSSPWDTQFNGWTPLNPVNPPLFNQNPMLAQNVPPKRQSTSSEFTSGPSSPWDTPLNAWTPPNPVNPSLFNQNPMPTQNVLPNPMQNQFPNFQSTQWPQYDPNWYWGQMGMNMPQWNHPTNTENIAPHQFPNGM